MPSDVEVEGPDGNTYQFPDGTDKAAAIRYFKAKGITGRSVQSPIPPPPLAGAPGGGRSSTREANDPRATMSKVYTFSGEPQRGLGSELKDMAIQAGEAGKQLPLTGPTFLHRQLQDAGVAPKGDLWKGEHSEQQNMQEDVPNAAIAIAGGVEGLEGDEVPTPRGRTVPKPPTGETLPPEQVEAVEKANRTYKAAKSQVERREGLQSASKSMVQKTYDNLQRTYKTARSALDSRWGQFRQGMEGVQLDPTKAFNDIEAAKAKYLKGSPASLQVFNNLAREMGIQEFMEGAGGELKAILGSGELPFDTARIHYSAIGDKLAQGNLPGNVYQALKSVQESLDKQLTDAAASRNLSKEYSGLKSDEHQLRTDWTDPKSPLARAHKALDANFLEPHVLGRGNEYLTKQLERYRKYGAEPHLPLAARRFSEEASAITKKIPEVKELPKPTAKGKGTGRMVRAVRRGAMKIAGGHIAGFPGYVAGGEADSALEDAIRKRRSTVPPPPTGDE
jgi:hypothetical protein